MKKTKLKIALASAAVVAAVATGTALAANGSSNGSGSDASASSASGSGSGSGSGTEQSATKTPGVIKADGPNVFPHSLGYDAQTKTFLAGSLAHGTVSSVGQDGKVRTLIDDPELVSAQAVNIDRERNRVLVSNVDYGLADRSRKDNPSMSPVWAATTWRPGSRTGAST
ncbi:hypothetical protein NKH77_33290 [Streptomyces sp. M19]